MRLICEGPCNGGVVQEFDEAVKHGTLGLALLKLYRGLRYTVHVVTRPDHQKCVECGTERRFGRSLHSWGNAIQVDGEATKA